MDENFCLTTRWLALTCLVLFGLFCVLAVLVLQLDFLQTPIALYGYVSLGVCSYLMGYSLRESRGFYILPRVYGVLSAILGIVLGMLVSELQFGMIGLLAVISVILVFLGLSLMHKPLAQ
ncbi:MAG: hypothetical protein P1Q69_07795 [Candidatus Thorarchaeota archaeon]|nr:hypothetical protein [Candidatus Thorarchaeota archaeon]